VKPTFEELGLPEPVAFPQVELKTWMTALGEASRASQEVWRVRAGYMNETVRAYTDYAAAVSAVFDQGYDEGTFQNIDVPELDTSAVDSAWAPKLTEAEAKELRAWGENRAASDVFWAAFESWIPE